MPCSCGGQKRVIVHEAHRPDGTVKRYLSETDARRDVARNGGHYAQISTPA